MNYFTSSQAIEFNFEGEFLGFAEPSHKCKYVRLKVLSDELHIKVAKELRPFIQETFRVGEKVSVSGVAKPDSRSHELVLQVQRMILVEYTHVSLPQSESHRPCKSKPIPCKSKIKVRVCQKSKCLKRGGKSLCESMEAALKDWDLHDQVEIERTGCLGRCSSAPNLVVHPGKHLHSGICVKTLPKFERLINRLVTNGKT